jgi:hypothetical protein
MDPTRTSRLEQVGRAVSRIIEDAKRAAGIVDRNTLPHREQQVLLRVTADEQANGE